MRIQATRSACIFSMACLVQFAAVRPVSAGDDAVGLLALGACSAAQKAAAATLANAASQGDAKLADALALNARIALDCQRPETPGLADWLARELELRTRSDGADSAAVVEVKLAQARHAQQSNRLDDALAMTQALDQQPARGRWPQRVQGRVASRMASIQNQRADATAFDSAGRAIELARAAHDDATLVQALQDRGFALARMRRGEEALVPLAEAKRVAKNHFGARSREYAEALRIDAQAARVAGDFGAAIEGLELSITIMRAQAEPDSHALANALLNLGQTQKVSGDSEHAAKNYEEVLALDTRDPDLQRPTRAATLHALANLERDRGNYARSIELYTEAEPLFERKYGAQAAPLAQVLNNHGSAEANLGHYDLANALYQRAVDIARARNSSDPGDFLPLANLAMVEIWQGRYVEAERGFRETIAHQQNVSVGSEVNRLFSSMGLASSLWGQQKLDAAFDAAVDAERVRQAALRAAASHLGERQAVNLQEYLKPSMDLVVSIAVASGKPEHLERAWEIGMAARDQVTTIRAQRLAAARTTSDPKVAALWQDWREASGALARLELTGVEPAPRREAQLRLDRAERALAGASPIAASLASAPLDFATLRRSLPADNSLVLFSTSQLRLPSDFAKDEAEKRAPDLFAFVLPTPDAPVRAVRLGSLEGLTRDIDAWTAALADRSVALASVTERGRKLRETLWQPLTQAGARSHWLVLPTSVLYRIPWSALPDGDGYLVDRGFRTHELNHERELRAASPVDAIPQLLAIADPVAAHNLPIASRRCAKGLTGLPGARRESVALDALWRTHYGDAAKSTLLIGADATEAKLRGAAGAADILHFGTHGISLANDCSSEQNALAVRGLALAADTPLDTGAPALRPAALLLAPGDMRHSDDDGVLTAEEIAALDLSNTRWAVLAACATATGSTHRYEGLFGLGRAFRLAGAHTVLTSLWPVDDAATAEWTMALYGARIERDLDTAASMADAQRSVLAARRARGDSTHPYYWAAFVAAGDWR